MEEHVIVDSSFSAIINAPLEQIDIPSLALMGQRRPRKTAAPTPTATPKGSQRQSTFKFLSPRFFPASGLGPHKQALSTCR
jgi:hypothetical protein